MAEAYKCDHCGRFFEDSFDCYSHELKIDGRIIKVTIFYDSNRHNFANCNSNPGVHMNDSKDICKNCRKKAIIELSKKFKQEKQGD